MSASQESESGIVLAIVLVMIFALITAVYAFQRRAIVDTTIASNRLEAAEADALAKGGLRLAEVLVAVVHAKQAGAEVGESSGAEGEQSTPGVSLSGGAGQGTEAIDALWQGIGNFPIRLDEARELQIEIEDEGAKLNLNALVPPLPSEDGLGGDALEGDDEDRSARNDGEDEGDGTEASEQAIEYLTQVMDYVIRNMPETEKERNYDARSIAENILDFMDGDETAVDGRSENEYYRRQDPPYSAWNAPLLSVDQLGLVEDVDAALLAELRNYVTVHPIGSTAGINMNRAEPWVLRLIARGEGQDYELISENLARAIYRLRDKGKLVCDSEGSDPRCVALGEVGNGEFRNGSIYPEASLPATPTVFHVVVRATVGDISRRFEAVYDTRPNTGPQLLSWRRLRGND